MDQGTHEFRLLVLAGDPATLRSKVTALADWLGAPPPVYSHLPIGINSASRDPVLSRCLEAVPASVTVLACYRSRDGNAILLRLQETCGARAELRLAGTSQGAPVTFRPFEIKTLRVDRAGVLREAGLTA